MNWILGIGKFVAQFFVGGSLEGILRTIERGLDNEVTKEEVKAEVTKEWIKAQAALLVGRTWWFQLFFVVPLGLWWTAIIIDSIMLHFGWYSHTTAALPSPLDDWAAWIISALFIVDGGKALAGRFKR